MGEGVAQGFGGDGALGLINCRITQDVDGRTGGGGDRGAATGTQHPSNHRPLLTVGHEQASVASWQTTQTSTAPEKWR